MMRFGGVLAAVLVVAACNPENQSQYAYTPSSTRVGSMAADTPRLRIVVPAMPDTVAEPPSFSTALATLAAPEAPGLRGTAMLRASGTGTAVAVALSDGEPGTHYEGSIRRGTCESLGPQVATLYPASADSTGAGRAASFVDVSLDDLLGSAHAIVHGEGGRSETCGPVRGAAATPPSVRE